MVYVTYSHTTQPLQLVNTRKWWLSEYVNDVCCFRLSLCDLAGAERAAKTLSTQDRLKETGNINTSLLTLSRCIEALRYATIPPLAVSMRNVWKSLITNVWKFSLHPNMFPLLSIPCFIYTYVSHFIVMGLFYFSFVGYLTKPLMGCDKWSFTKLLCV